MPDAAKRSYLRKLRAAGPTTEAERHELEHADNVYENRWWMTVRDVKWYENADAVAAFYQVNGRWPNGAAAGEDERRLGGWLSKQRYIPPVEERKAYLDEVAPGWLDVRHTGRPRGVKSADRMSAAQEYIALAGELGRLPSRYSDDSTEVGLDLWRSSQLAVRRRHPDRKDPVWSYLDEHLPGWAHRRKSGPKPKDTE